MANGPSFLFERWPRFAARHPWPVIAGAVAALAACAGLFAVARGQYADHFSIPGMESQRAINLLKERFPASAGDRTNVVVRAPDGLNSPDAAARMESLLANLEALPQVLFVTPASREDGSVSEDGTIARIGVQHEKRANDLEQESIDALLDLRAASSTGDFQVEMGGRVINMSEREPPGSTELIGMGAAVVVLLIAFGSVVAMGLPILTALLALGSGFFLVGVGAAFLRMPAFTPQFSAMIGIGVGIDYALLVVTRFREGLGSGLGVEDAIARAAATAGRSVMLAGSTVVVALLGLWAIGIPFVAYTATAAALVVALSVAVSVVVLPAILALAGSRIDRWRIPGLAAPVHESATGSGYRLSRLIQRAPLVPILLTTALLATLAVPVFSMRLGVADAGHNPTSQTSRRAYDLLAEAFGPGFNGAILLAVQIDDPNAVGAVEALPDALRQLGGVARASDAVINDAQTAATVSIVAETAPDSEATADLVHELRRVAPEALAGTGATVYVGGSTASFIDVADKIGSRMPYFLAAVIGLSFVLLMVMFRSLLVPLKAAAMNMLSIGASYGVLVTIFQWGWLGGVFGVQREGPVESFLPMMLFAVLFGLSMDYEVFLVSRIREEYLRTGDNTEAVARGLSVTTRVISAAAAIMTAVFLSFALSSQRIVKEFGIGLATAILIDATLVRLVLVPSVMQILGDANWWLPAWLDRVIPKVSLEQGVERAPAEATG